MIGLRKTYEDVSKELAEGLADGTIALEDGSAEVELASFAFLTFRFLAPCRFDFSAPAEGPGDGGQPRLVVERDSREYDQLPENIRMQFQQKLDDLRGRGFEVEIKDSDDRAAAVAT